MLWKLTERQVVYLLRKKRRVRSVSRRTEKLPDGKKISYGQSLDDHMRQNYGLKKDDFRHVLFLEEFYGTGLIVWLKQLYIKLRPVYYEHFFSDFADVLEKSIKSGSIVQSVRPEGTFIKEDTEVARKMLAWYYYPKILIEYEPVRDLLKEFIKWAVIAFLGYIGITHVISAVINR